MGEITLVTQDDRCWAGTVIADLVSEEGGLVLLGGIGHLRPVASMDAA